MSNQTLFAVLIAAVVVIGGYFAWQAYERDRNTLEINIGEDGVQIDPPGN